MLLRGDRGFPCGSAGNESACSARDLGLILKISWRRERLPTPVFPDNSVGKESACNAGDPGLIPGLGRSDRKGKGYPLQYSGLETSMDLYSPWCHKESDMTE